MASWWWDDVTGMQSAEVAALILRCRGVSSWGRMAQVGQRLGPQSGLTPLWQAEASSPCFLTQGLARCWRHGLLWLGPLLIWWQCYRRCSGLKQKSKMKSCHGFCVSGIQPERPSQGWSRCQPRQGPLLCGSAGKGPPPARVLVGGSQFLCFVSRGVSEFLAGCPLALTEGLGLEASFSVLPRGPLHRTVDFLKGTGPPNRRKL